jgi:hypothetical protein
MLTWLGTLFGGIVVSGSQGNLGVILLGAALVLVSVLPLAIQGFLQLPQSVRSDVLEARESVAREFGLRALRMAADLEQRARADRVGLSGTGISEAMDSLWNVYFAENPRVRIVLYLAAPDGKSLAVQDVRGRSGKSPRDFRDSDARGQIAIKHLSSSSESIYVANTADSPVDWGARDRDYTTFIRLPIRTSTVAYGMLTVDSSKVSDLDEQDASALEAYSTALAFFLATAARGQHSTQKKAGEAE